jgi:hypothetical protein
MVWSYFNIQNTSLNMKTLDNITLPELDGLVEHFPCEDGLKLPPAKEWKRVDVGSIEVYVGFPGAGLSYVVGLIEKIPQSMNELEANGESAENVIIKYLQSEGFIGEEFIYIGLQRFDLQNPPEDAKQ